jgi:NAD(P)-dependent dehydrogenase (short-subunit alcohol dehydrogenase family)
MERVALITGATGGLGGAVVEGFVAAGWKVVAGARRAYLPRGALARQVQVVTGDLTDEAEAGKAVAAAAAKFGRLDALVNLVGGFAGGEPVASLPTETWRQMMRINLDAAMYLSRAAIAPLKAAGGGCILHVGSWAGSHPMAGFAAYAASKAALEALAATLAEELRGDGITVNVVAPKMIDTPANRASLPAAALRGASAPEAIARVLLFLASAEGAAVTGAVVPV